MSKRSALSQGLGTASKITRNNLERVGAFIDSVNANSAQARQFEAVDLDDQSQKQDLLREETLKASQQLLGSRFATYGKYAKKVVPDSVFQKAIDSAFAQVAKLAASWSQVDLPNAQQHSSIKNLDNEQRYALATDIANQNRALATLGGITGLAGLPGLLADTLWLLLVSLRTVYQIAAVYDQPLTGKQGIKIAYGILSNADLSKMQEKQALLAGLGMAKGLLKNADNQGLRNELKNVGVKNQNVGYYAEQIDNIAEQFNIDIDHINLGWLTKFLPLTSVAVGMHYNSHLIEEVIGVANATFAPEPKLANRLLSNQSEDQSSANESKVSHLKEDMKARVSDAKDALKDKLSQDSNQAGDSSSADQSDQKSAKALLDTAKSKAADAKEALKDSVSQDNDTNKASKSGADSENKKSAHQLKEDVKSKAADAKDALKDKLSQDSNQAGDSSSEDQSDQKSAKALLDTAKSKAANAKDALKDSVSQDNDANKASKSGADSENKKSAHQLKEDVKSKAADAKDALTDKVKQGSEDEASSNRPSNKTKSAAQSKDNEKDADSNKPSNKSSNS